LTELASDPEFPRLLTQLLVSQSLPHLMDAADLAGWRRQSGWPAWLLSLLLHFSVLISLGFVAGKTPEGAADEPARAGGIVLVNRQAGKAQYFSEDNGNGAPGAAASASVEQATPNPFPDSQEQPTIAGGPKLPEGRGPLVGAAPAAGGSLPSAGSLAQGGGSGGPLGRGQDFGVQTQVFGVRPGQPLRYVFDRSGSMSGYEGRPLLPPNASCSKPAELAGRASVPDRLL
jgi:hypothetical protein